MNYYPNYLCDLHCHTNRSDGNDEPAELIEKAGGLGMKIIAITDHDKVPPTVIVKDGIDIDIEAYADSLNVDLIKGIEISCDTDVEEVHLIGLGCDWESPYFKKIESIAENSKVESYRKLTEVLSATGINVSWDEILNNGGAPFEPGQVQKKFIFEMIARKGYAKSWQDAKLMVKNNPRFNIKREKPDPKDVIDGIHKSGGIVILAHPYLIEEEINLYGSLISREEYIDGLIDRGLDGIEACYTYDKTSYKGKKTKDEIYDEVVLKYKDRLKVLSGGSDYHADHKKGVKAGRNIGECGVTPEYFYNNALLSKLSHGSK